MARAVPVSENPTPRRLAIAVNERLCERQSKKSGYEAESVCRTGRVMYGCSATIRPESGKGRGRRSTPSDHSEDGRVRPDPESESRDGDDRERGRAAEKTQAVTRILKEPLERRPAPLRPRDFLDERLVAELAAGGGLGLGGRLPAGDAFGNRHLQVRRDLLVELALPPPASEDGKRELHAGAAEASSTPAIACSSRSQRERSAESFRRPATVSR